MNNQRITYEEACKAGLLQSIADGKFWYVSQSFADGRQFVPQALQQTKAAIILQELAAQIAKFGDIERLSKETCGDGSYVDVMSRIMLLRINADSKFMDSISRAAVPITEPEPRVESTTEEPSGFDKQDESSLSADEKLARAKESTRGLL